MKLTRIFLPFCLVTMISNGSPLTDLAQALQQLSTQKPLSKKIAGEDPKITQSIIENLCWGATIALLKPDYTTVADAESAQLLLFYLLTIFPEADPKAIGKKLEKVVDPTKETAFHKTMKLLSEKLATWKGAEESKDSDLKETITLLAEHQPAQLLKDLFILSFKLPLESTGCLKDLNPLLFQEKKLPNKMDVTVSTDAMAAGFSTIVERLKLNKTDVIKFFNLLNDTHSCLAPKKDSLSKNADAAIKQLLESLEKGAGWGDKIAKQEEDDENKVPLEDHFKLLALHNILNAVFFNPESTISAAYFLNDKNKKLIGNQLETLYCEAAVALAGLDEINKICASIFKNKTSQKRYQEVMKNITIKFQETFIPFEKQLKEKMPGLPALATNHNFNCSTSAPLNFIKQLILLGVRTTLIQLNAYARYIEATRPHSFPEKKLPPPNERFTIIGPSGDRLFRTFELDYQGKIAFTENPVPWLTITLLENSLVETFKLLDFIIEKISSLTLPLPLKKDEYDGIFKQFRWGGMSNEFYPYDFQYCEATDLDKCFYKVAEETKKLAQKYAQKDYLKW